MKNKMTHTGVLFGCDSRTPDNYTQKVLLRKTKKFWVTQHGIKYRIEDGYGIGDFPMCNLNLSSIKMLPKC